VLILFGYSKISKYNREDEYIIYRKGFLDDVSREEFESLLLSEPVIDKSVKYKCK
jgi:hypothetical protein